MTTLELRRKNTLNLFREATKLGSFDEFPVLRPEVDPQLLVSHSDVDQPFYLCCEKDCVVALVSGAARLEFASGSVRFFDMETGDFVYVPGGTPHRLRITQSGVQLRYKAREAGLESAIWYCSNCGSEVHQHLWDTASILSQDGYHIACEQFNLEEKNRVCPECGEAHSPVDVRAFRWQAVANTLRAQAEGEA
ncbi:hypothetical protein QHI69_20335 [Burkholderia gladioli pv. gladioli]|uniref:Cupin domain protein n=1 Tax=Burkholderia gladioli TaxID=28095 RepID=A0A095F2Y9_BURGA|nr:hypothetical protein [Burkholderia gladioli]AJW97031.1 cupin domain protein [Burkholderia gladioli]ASD79973.1 hypothetical protein CEJ98_13940 [Burkholderia gladioli pv. gladioli]AWY54781.1 hypothetical protein A8H28_27190 [Burkholderia gladioli pv. gladioli]KGC11350.1 cupin domain protein [Burkholderia gladioli]MDJ1164231.1 hypothetical protein [Burkholderia gladioli pv. gladioli]